MNNQKPTLTQLKKEVNSILKHLPEDSLGYKIIQTKMFGDIIIRIELNHKSKVYSIYMRFIDDKFNIENFKKYISEVYTPNPYSKKYNFHSKDAEWIVDKIKDIIEDFKYIDENYIKQ